MKVILLQDVKNVGKKDEIKEVNDGYATNYLIPRKLVVVANNTNLLNLEKQKINRAKELEEQKNLALKVKDLLKDITLEFKMKSAPDGRMVGTISYKQVEEELKNTFNIVIDKRKIIDHYLINAFGYTRLKIELFKDVIGVINVHVSELK